MTPDRLITLAIHTYERALPVKSLLEREGIYVELNNVNLCRSPWFSPGVRLRIKESDLPLALRIVENMDIFTAHDATMAGKGVMLVPTDFTPLSLSAAKLAMQLAAKQKWEIEFLNAFISPATATLCSSQTHMTMNLPTLPPHGSCKVKPKRL